MATIITNAAGLAAITSSGDYELGNDINLNGVSWTSLCPYTSPFAGTLDGKGYTISHLTNAALFSMITTGAVVQNIIFEDCSNAVADNGYIIAIFCSNISGGTISNIKFLNCDITIISESYNSSLMGENDDPAIISQCYSDSNCSITGSVLDTRQYVGMLFSNIHEGSSVSQCEAHGVINISNTGYYTIVGGLCSVIEDNTIITNCCSAVDITVAGGVGYGYRTTIGGFVGDTSPDFVFTLTNCYSVGTLSASGTATTISGLVINNGGTPTVTSCYWKSGCGGTGGLGTETSDANMKLQATYTDWDFTTIWQIVEGVSYPTLQAFASAGITTLAADQIGYAGQAARLNGSGGDGFDSNYFQYGQSATSLNLSTSPKAGTASFSEFITALNPAITYYFRAVGRTWNGLTYDYAYGEVLNFLSPGTADVINPHNYGYMWIEGTAIHLATESAGIEKAYLGEVV